MGDEAKAARQTASAIPADDLRRKVVVRPNSDEKLLHVGVVGDTYTILLGRKDTAGRFCLIDDMYVPPGGGPPPHRHDFEEAFTVLKGEIEAVFRGAKQIVQAGETISVPANAPHQFHNSSSEPVRLLCFCSPPGLEELFLEIGVPVESRTTPPPKLEGAAQAEIIAKIRAAAPKYRTELFPHA